MGLLATPFVRCRDGGEVVCEDRLVRREILRRAGGDMGGCGGDANCCRSPSRVKMQERVSVKKRA